MLYCYRIKSEWCWSCVRPTEESLWLDRQKWYFDSSCNHFYLYHMQPYKQRSFKKCLCLWFYKLLDLKAICYWFKTVPELHVNLYLCLTSVFTSITALLTLYGHTGSMHIKRESCVSMCYRFPKPPKVPGSWHFGSRPNLGQLKTWRSPIFEILIFKGGSPYGPVLKIWDKLCSRFPKPQKVPDS